MAEQLYIYPAVFTTEAGAICVHFPDLPECCTCGVDETDALSSAQEALELCLLTREEDNEPIPAATNAVDVATESGQVVVLVQADMILAREGAHSKSEC